MKRAVWLLLGGLAGCRACAASPAGVDAAVSPSDAATADSAAPKLGTIDTILFSPKAHLAFLYANSDPPTAFRVIDVRTGQQRVYQGAPPRTSMLGFDNRCDVSERGYMPNVDVWYAETDETDNFFVRHIGDRVIREDFARGVPATPVHDPVQLNDDNVVVDLGTSKVTIPFPGTGSTVDYLDVQHGVLVIHRPEKDDKNEKRCLFDLRRRTPVGAAGICAVYQPPSPFAHVLASDDGEVFAWNSLEVGKTTVSPNDEYARDTSADRCFMHIANLAVGKAFKTKSPCTITGERPLRVAGGELVTDNSNIYRCSAVVTRQYDPRSGALKVEMKKAPYPDDIDDKLAAVIAKGPKEGMISVQKQSAWPSTYGLDALVAWSEGDSVLARRGTDLLLCKKRGGTCGAALMPIGKDDVAGAAKDGTVFGVVSKGRFVVFDAARGVKTLDVPLSD